MMVMKKKSDYIKENQYFASVVQPEGLYSSVCVIEQKCCEESPEINKAANNISKRKLSKP